MPVIINANIINKYNKLVLEALEYYNLNGEKDVVAFRNITDSQYIPRMIFLDVNAISDIISKKSGYYIPPHAIFNFGSFPYLLPFVKFHRMDFHNEKNKEKCRTFLLNINDVMKEIRKQKSKKSYDKSR